MDPFSITSAILSITKKCCTTASVLHEIRTKHKDAPTTITSICSQTTVISASLSQLQYLILRKNDLSTVLERRPDLAAALDCSMIGCVMLFSCLDDEIARVTKVTQSGNFNWRGKARMSWNQETLRQMLEDLRSQQAALSTLINLFQVDSFAELKTLLDLNKSTFEDTVQRTRTLRKSNPNVQVRKSIYIKDDNISEDSFSIAPSTHVDPSSPNQPSEIQFNFDDLVKNSRVYQQMLAQDQLTQNERVEDAVEGDLIDLTEGASEEDKSQHDSQDAAVQQLRELIISDDEADPDKEDHDATTGQLPPRLHLPEDISKSLDIQRTSLSPEPDRTSENPLPDAVPTVDEESDDDSSPVLVATEKQLKTLSQYDPVLFNAPIPDDRSKDRFDFAVIPATPLANVEMHFDNETGPSARGELPSPEPSTRSRQTSSTSTQSFQSLSSSSDTRRHTSYLEVDYSDQPNSPNAKDEVIFYSRPSTSEARTRSEQTSPTPSASNQSSYYGRQRTPSGDVYPRPQAQRNLSSQSTDTSTRDRSSSQPKSTAFNTLRKPFFRRKASATQYCYRCKGPLTGTFITAMGVAFHNGCFRCADCNKILEGTAFPYKRSLEDGSQETIPLCEMDYFQRLDPICRQCGNGLCDSFMSAFEGTRKKHLESFSCGKCEKVFRAPYSYFRNEQTGKVYC